MAKILVIEDELEVRENVIEILRFEDHEAMGAPNGLIGLQLAREYLPDLILCDIMMPELDGYSVLLELRRQPLTAEIPFVFLTARTAKIDQRTGMELGAEDYLTKPFTHGELISAVQTQLEKRAARVRITRQELEGLRERILTALPHELNTPLAGILGYSGFLSTNSDTMSSQEIAQIAQVVFKSASRLQRLIENYLTYVQIELISQDPKWQERLRQGRTSDPHSVIKTCAQAVAQNKGRVEDLSLKIEDGPTVCILGDYLKKAAEELIDNAFKFSSVKTAVHVLAVNAGDSYIVEIRNLGRGMTVEQISQIGAYMQFDRKQHEQQGSGMGLIIAKRLIELHGGQLVIESIPDQNIAFRFAIPVITE